MLIVNSFFANFVIMTLLNRIKELAKENSTNIKALEISAGLGNGTIRRWDDSPPSADKLLKIANLLNTTMDFLMTGETGAIPILRTEDAEWLDLIHQLPLEAQYEFRGELKGYLKRFNEESVAADESLKKTGTTNSAK